MKYALASVLFALSLGLGQVVLNQNKPNPHFQKFFSTYFSPARLHGMSNLEKVWYANSVVATHCQNIPPHEADYQKLFANCRTACGGFSYVLVETLRALGFQAGFLNIYNVPQQGNHSMVEVTVDGRTLHLDPTFGVVFAGSNGPSTLFEACRDPENRIRTTVFKNGRLENWRVISNAELGKKYFSKKAYCKFEDFTSPTKLGLTLNLDLAQWPQQQWGNADAKDLQQIDQSVLKLTNDSLNDVDPTNDVSFRISFVGKVNDLSQKNRIQFAKGSRELSVKVWAPKAGIARIESASGAQLEFSLTPGFQELKFPLKADDDAVSIAATKSFFRMFFVKVSESGSRTL